MTNNLPTNWQELQAAIEQWGTDRNFYGEGGATYTGQWMKLVEEFGELVLGLNKNKPELIKDALGDMVVVLVHMAKLNKAILNIPLQITSTSYGEISTAVICLLHQIGLVKIPSEPNKFTYTQLLNILADVAHKELNLPLFDCVLASYIEIKDRKGQMIDGKFIKNKDLN